MISQRSLDISLKRLEPSTQELEHLIEDGHALLAKGFGPGFNGPLQVAIALPRHHDTAAVTQVTRALARTPGSCRSRRRA